MSLFVINVVAIYLAEVTYRTGLIFQKVYVASIVSKHRNFINIFENSWRKL